MSTNNKYSKLKTITITLDDQVYLKAKDFILLSKTEDSTSSLSSLINQLLSDYVK